VVTAAGQALTELEQWGRNIDLNPLDALMWRTEKPPSNSWAGIVLMVLESAPSWKRLVEAHEWGLKIVPRFRDRIISPPVPLGPPLWSTDTHFDLSYHLRRVKLPEPGTLNQVLELAQTQAVIPLDRRRSPWVATLIEGLEDGRAAYILQAHHVLMDGAGATELFGRILDRTPDGTLVEPPDHSSSRPQFGAQDALGHSLFQMARGIPHTLGLAGQVVANAARSPRRAIEYARSATRVMSPPAPIPAFLRGGSRTSWRFGALDCELAVLKAAGKSAGGTVNDAFVAAVLGGLRRYFISLGCELPDIPISMPVSVRTQYDDMGGNRFTGAFFSAPASISDPAERIRTMRQRVSAVREEPALDVMGSITPLLNFAPSAVVSSAMHATTSMAVTTVSSWPGLAEPSYVAGKLFERMYVFGPLPGTPMCAAMCSHVGTCCIGINVDADIFAELPALWTAMRDGLDEVLALAA